MKKKQITYIFCLVVASFLVLTGCAKETPDSKEAEIVDKQQEHFGRVQPIPFYDYSIPRDVLIQIYNVITQEARSTYTVVETVMGQTKWRCPSIGYGIPADTSLTNPKKPVYRRRGNEYSATIGQAEPNGLHLSKNTDGTYCLCVADDGTVYPFYTEHKANTWPFIVDKDDNGEWHRVDNKPIGFKIDLSRAKREVKKALNRAQ